MKVESEKALRVKSLSQDILEHLMEDSTSYNHEDLKHVIECFRDPYRILPHCIRTGNAIMKRL